MKYIVDLPDDSDTEYAYDQDTKELKFPSPRIDPTSFMGLEIVLTNVVPYEELDRKDIEDEVWKFARAVNDMRYDDFVSCFGGKTEEAVYELSYSEVKAEYDAWKKQKDEIYVGDEVEAEPGNKACTLCENPDGTQIFVFKADGTVAWWSKCTIHKTGKNYPEFAELLKKMRDEE